MRSGKDGEYYYAELSKDEVIKLKEIVEKKAKERTNVRKPSYARSDPLLFHSQSLSTPGAHSPKHGLNL